MVAHVRVEEKPTPGFDRRNAILAILAGLLSFVHWGLVDFDPEPYGTLPIDSSEVDLFAPAGGSPVLIFAVVAILLFGRRVQIAARHRDAVAFFDRIGSSPKGRSRHSDSLFAR